LYLNPFPQKKGTNHEIVVVVMQIVEFGAPRRIDAQAP